MLRVMKIDPNLDTLHTNMETMQIHLNTIVQVDHSPKAEQLIHITRDITRFTLTSTPFKRIPAMLTIRIILETIFWGNDIAANCGVLRIMIPDAIITGR